MRTTRVAQIESVSSVARKVNTEKKPIFQSSSGLLSFTGEGKGVGYNVRSTMTLKTLRMRRVRWVKETVARLTEEKNGDLDMPYLTFYEFHNS